MPKTLEERLNAHPELKAQLLALLELAESDIPSADEVEERTVEPIRSLGRQVIQDWAKQQEQTFTEEIEKRFGDKLKLRKTHAYDRQVFMLQSCDNGLPPQEVIASTQ